jgi:hypothetical protein
MRRELARMRRTLSRICPKSARTESRSFANPSRICEYLRKITANLTRMRVLVASRHPSIRRRRREGEGSMRGGRLHGGRRGGRLSNWRDVRRSQMRDGGARPVDQSVRYFGRRYVRDHLRPQGVSPLRLSNLSRLSSNSVDVTKARGTRAPHLPCLDTVKH